MLFRSGYRNRGNLSTHVLFPVKKAAPQLHATQTFSMSSIQRIHAVSYTAIAVILIVNNSWFRCSVGILDPRLQYTLECFLTALIIGISSSVIFYHHHLGKESVDTVYYQNRCLKIGAGVAVVLGMGWPGYRYRRDILGLILDMCGSGGVGSL